MLRQSYCEDRAPGNLRDCPRLYCCTPSWMGGTVWGWFTPYGWEELSEAGLIPHGWEELSEAGGKILALTFSCYGTIIICVLSLWCKCHYVVHECSWIIYNFKNTFQYIQRILKCINMLKTSVRSPNLYICQYIHVLI